MTKITVPKNCGNSPKSMLIIDLYKRLFAFDLKKTAALVSDDVSIVVHGKDSYTGKDGLNDLIEDMKTTPAKLVSITNVLSHGKFVAVHGEIILDDDSKIAFAEVFAFTSNSQSAKIQKIDSYVLTVK